MARDYAAEYARRIARAAAQGKSKTAARGHAKTPEHPERALKNPGKYKEYLDRRSDEVKQVQARKERLWGDRIGFKPAHSEANTQRNPQTKTRIDTQLARKFLRMSADEADKVASRVATLINQGDHSMDDWAFLFYH